MRTRDIKTLVVDAQLRNWIFVKVETGVPGLYGWGEGKLDWVLVIARADAIPVRRGRGPVFQRSCSDGRQVSKRVRI